MTCLLHRWGLALALLPALAWSQVQITAASAGEISTARAEPVRYTVRTAQPGRLALEILSGDGDVVRRIEAPGSVAAGDHVLAWDGKDLRGQPVPDEAWCPRAVLFDATGRRLEDDPCTRTGGEVITGLQPQVTPGGDIAYTLEQPGRVLIRVGYKNGAMMRSLSVWRPRPAGRNLQRWNGFDDSGIVDLRNDRLSLLVTAFRLPDFSVVSAGNPQVDYRAWRTALGFAEKPDTPQGGAAQPLERNGQRIARQHYMARYKDAEPRIRVTFAQRDGTPLAAGAPLPADVKVEVDLHPDDRWLMQEQLYEVAFFVNGDFVSEEENGYVPIGWLWNTSGLKPGRHLFTVNLTGFTGRVGTKSIAVQK